MLGCASEKPHSSCAGSRVGTCNVQYVYMHVYVHVRMHVCMHVRMPHMLSSGRGSVCACV